MSALFSFKKIIKALAKTSMLLVCVTVIMLLTASCSTKQAASTDTAASSLTANKQQELECRSVESTGSRFKRKVCKPKETWAAIDKKNKGAAEELVRGLNEQSGVPSGNQSPNGITNTPTTAPGGF